MKITREDLNENKSISVSYNPQAVIKMDGFKDRCEEATRFIESCFDENNEEDGLTFDERINQRINELPADVRDIITTATDSEPQVYDDDELVEIEEIIMEESTEKVFNSLETQRKLKKEYLTKELEFKKEKARLRLETDWSTAIEGKTRPSNDDKDAYIFLETLSLKEEVATLKLEAEYQKEIYELEKILLRKK